MIKGIGETTSSTKATHSEFYDIGVIVKEKKASKNEVPASQACTNGCTNGTCSVGTCHACKSFIKV